MGSDNLISFHKWKSWKKIVKLSKLIVFSRRGYDKKGMKSVVARYFKNKIVFIKNKPISISSSKLRKKMY
jgi:nicotinate-nucleotide adenylyltransferase